MPETQDAGLWTLDAGHLILDSGYLDIGFEFANLMVSIAT
jgi:hypothetical protein